MIQEKFVEIGEWLPDQPALGNKLILVQNAIPNIRSWRSVPSAQQVTVTGIDEACLATVWAVASDGTVYNFAADATKLYRLVSGSYSDVSKAAGAPYAAISWAFDQWGDWILATSLEEPLQYFDMAGGATFLDVAGSPPQAKVIAVIRDHVVLGHILNEPSRVQWSGFNNVTQWTPSKATQSDLQDLKGRGGKVQAIVGGEYGTVFQDNAIYLMTYVGPPLIFQFDEISRDRGTPAANSVCFLGRDIFFWAHDGFYMLQGRELTPIGFEKVDQFVADDLDISQVEKFRGSIDRKNRLVMWTYPSLSKGKQQIICYRWDMDRWGYIDEEIDCLFDFLSSGEDLDTIGGVLASNDIDASSINVDSTAYLGGALAQGGINADGQLVEFTGAAKAATFIFGEESTIGLKAKLKNVRPVVDAVTTLTVGTRQAQADNVAWDLATALNANGEFDRRSSARYHTIRLDTTGSFDHAQGVYLRFRDGGRK